MRFPKLPAPLAACLLLLLAAPAAAQDRGSVTGMVVSAETQQPLAGAQVVLHAAPMGVLAPGSGARPLLLGDGLAAVTDSAGAYRFSGLAAGRYRMYVYALGYRPVTLEVRLGGREASHLSVGLRVATVVLERIVITAAASQPFGSPAGVSAGDDLAAGAERIRQRRFLAPDARAITRADVQQAVTLGESDLFRALQRLPGVATRDDYTTELWTRGAPWDQTAVLFDGVPLFNPLHAAGAVAAVSPDAVGAVFFHPGVQPAELASGAAGLVDLRTRRGGAEGTRAAAELSLLSGRASADGEALGGRLGWMLSARRSHLDVLAVGIRALGGDSTVVVPYGFHDVAGRVDLRLGGGARLEVSALHEGDRLDGAVPGLVREATARWGSAAGQATLAHPLLGGELRHTLGASRFFARGGDAAADAAGRFPLGNEPAEGPYRLPPLDNGVRWTSLAGSWEGPRAARPVQLSGGWRLVSQETRYRTSGLWPYRAEPGEAVAEVRRLRYGVLWAEAEGDVAPRLRVEAGARAELGDPVWGSPPVRLAPRLAARWQATPETGVSAGVARTWQYAQALVPAGPGHDGVAIGGLFWTLAGDTVPVVRSDLYTLGVERWFGEGILASAAAYRREAVGVLVPDPREGWLDGRPLAVPARNRAHGVEASVRRLAGRWTGSAAYAWGVSELEAMGVRWPAPTGRDHSLDLGAMLRLAGSFRAGAAYTLASGTRFTRYEGVLQDCDEGAGGCRYATYARAPGAQRAPTYRSLDLLADWNGRVGRWGVAAYAQLRNVLRRDNVGAYRASEVFCAKSPGQSCHPILQPHPDSFRPEMNQFLPGLPFIPFAGVRVAF